MFHDYLDPEMNFMGSEKVILVKRCLTFLQYELQTVWSCRHESEDTLHQNYWWLLDKYLYIWRSTELASYNYKHNHKHLFDNYNKPWKYWPGIYNYKYLEQFEHIKQSLSGNNFKMSAMSFKMNLFFFVLDWVANT